MEQAGDMASKAGEMASGRKITKPVRKYIKTR